MKIPKQQLKEIIKEELFYEGQGGIGNFGGVAGGLASVRPSSAPREDTPDSAIQQEALEFFATLRLTSKVVEVLVGTIAIPDLIELMDKIPKLDTAAEEEII
jgi:hypothetical protein